METRVATVWRIFDTPTRAGGTRYETFFTGVDGSTPTTFAAVTYEPFTATFLEDARLENRALWVTVAKDAIGGLDLIRAEHASPDSQR